MKTFHYDYVGVYSPKGELESVEMTQASADAAALNLSPLMRGSTSIHVLNRKTGPVTVFAGTPDEMVECLFNAASTEWLELQIKEVKAMIHARETENIRLNAEVIRKQLIAEGKMSE